ncbi:MAG: GNAT family N-acetyltransferase [Myxococcales bacterium]|nr:GNAT family N-acetyltransferase [Myxococcales bacterium]MDH3484650.1 GNAT family N-acetyltransferase [Myxococcales bacterium]
MGVEKRQYRYGDSYQETVELSDGQRVEIRPIRPSDKQMLLDGFEQLSPESRYARFMTPKKSLTDWELRYLTEVDGIDHFAIGAVRRHLVSRDEGVGSGRFVRLADQPDTAEPAVTILDGFQGKGLGTLMLQRLIEAAWERDIRWFRSVLLSGNVAMKRLAESLSPEVKFRASGDGCLVATFPVPEPDKTPTAPGFFKGTALYRALAHVARADVTVQPRVTRPPPEPD